MARTHWRRSVRPATRASELSGQRPGEGLKWLALVLREDFCPVEGKWAGEEGSGVSGWVLTVTHRLQGFKLVTQQGEQRGMAGVGRGQWAGPWGLALVWKEEERRLKRQGFESRFQVSGEGQEDVTINRGSWRKGRLEDIWSFTVNTKEIHQVLYW